MGWSGLEPPTSRLSGVCSNQLSYQPVLTYHFFSFKHHHDAWKVHSKKDFSSKYFVSAPTNRNFAYLADLKGRTLSFTFLFHLSCKQAFLLRKEVIQPHLPIRLPCYDFTLIINPTFDCCLLTVSSQASGVIDSHGVTGGVYKARERIHRGMLIRDY